jgi:hypothetical protein
MSVHLECTGNTQKMVNAIMFIELTGGFGD